MEEIRKSASNASGAVVKKSSSGGARTATLASYAEGVLNVSLGGVENDIKLPSAPDLKDIFPSGEDLAKEQSLPVMCPLFGRTLHECTPDFHKTATVSPDMKESVTSAEKAVHGILEEIVTRAVRFKIPKRLKTPVMKSGWMSLQDVIPHFNIDDATFKSILFRENLLVSMFEENSSYPTPVGALSLDIQSARGGPLRYNNKKTRDDFLSPKFLVHLASHLDFYGHNGGSKITAWVDRDLQTLEESRKEFVRMDADDVDKQSLYVNSQDDFYYLRHNKTDDIYCSPQKAKNLICEGSDFVLMRYLAITKFIGTFEVSTLYINGDLCRNIYKCNGPQGGIIYNKKIDVCKIYRTIVERCGIEHRSITLMTLGGRILKQEWNECNYILQVNPLVDVGAKPSPRERVPLDKSFESDIQLLSLYLDAKTVNKKRIESYMNDHPEIRNYISDYVQTILQLKPENVIEFSAKYFLGFTPQLLPYSEYFEPSESGQAEDVEFWKYF